MLAPALRFAAVGPAQFLQTLTKRGQPRLHFSIIAGKGDEYTGAPHLLALLRARRNRPQS